MYFIIQVFPIFNRIQEECSEYDAEYSAKIVRCYIDQLETEYPGFAKYYHTLCEFVRTNSDGVGLSISLLDENPPLKDGIIVVVSCS